MAAMGRFMISISEEQIANALKCVAEPPEEKPRHIEVPIVDVVCPQCDWKRARVDSSAGFFECCLCGYRNGYEKQSGNYYVYDKTTWHTNRLVPPDDECVDTYICEVIDLTTDTGADGR